MQVVVRQAESQDMQGLAEVDASMVAALRKVYRPTEASLRRYRSQDKPRPVQLVAVLDGRVVGAVKYRVEDNSLHLIGLGVLEAFRGQGICRRIVEHARGIASEHGLSHLSLYTIRQTGNVPIFEKLGFVVAEESVSTDSVSAKYDQLTDVFMLMSIQLHAR